ncbi:MAG: sensor histidine kinase [Lysobacterales bacterium]
MSRSDSPQWLPEFCSLPTLFAVMVVAELVALVVCLGPNPGAEPLLPRLGVLTVYVQWLALVNAALLCSLRKPLEKLPVPAGYTAAWVASVLLTTIASAVIARIDQVLMLGLAVPRGQGWRFVLANATICALIAAGLLRYLFVSIQWRERFHAAAKAQVDALQARIRPHFLFNSMNTIAGLIRSQPAAAERAVENLAELFRAALAGDGAPGTLGDELQLIDDYLGIEQLRLGDRLRVERNLDALPRELPVPRLLLQPLVENAVYHGIQPLPGGGTVTLSAARTGNAVEITIRNPRPEAAASRGNGHALDNIRARIAYHYGNRGHLRIEEPPGEFIAVARLPTGAG